MEDKVITIKDLEAFGRQLFADIKNLIGEREPQNTTLRKSTLRSGEVKLLLGISAGTLKNYRINGVIRCRKVGGSYQYDKSQVEKLISNIT
ncbi:helix-turn-helix domain-containing protein [Chitinophaga barathri]|uniref:DNA-binding protein n=1 Tax=Chitinophaga barathri TaxID=1647451 RepID=A0A3N4MI73_9BACT|nr:helix-turn-helix domain-containing protein [Chitinophaga barathri]RPD39349.1 DNA-binding protein [Chitinophaga barathri]